MKYPRDTWYNMALKDPPDDDDDYDHRTEDDEKNLPVRASDMGPLERLRAKLARDDGFMSPSNASVPAKAADIGDVEERPNPRAEGLDYPEGVALSHDQEAGKDYLGDGPTVATSGERWIATEDMFIEDVRNWA